MRSLTNGFDFPNSDVFIGDRYSAHRQRRKFEIKQFAGYKKHRLDKVVKLQVLHDLI